MRQIASVRLITNIVALSKLEFNRYRGGCAKYHSRVWGDWRIQGPGAWVLEAVLGAPLPVEGPILDNRLIEGGQASCLIPTDLVVFVVLLVGLVVMLLAVDQGGQNLDPLACATAMRPSTFVPSVARGSVTHGCDRHR